MLTCEQIAEKARAINPKITRENYADIADTILRPIASDLTRLNAGKVVLHMFIIPKE